MIQEAPSSFHRDKQIKIAFLVRFPAGYGPEHPDITCTMPSRNSKNLFPLIFQHLVDTHDPILWYSNGLFGYLFFCLRESKILHRLTICRKEKSPVACRA